MNETKTTPRRTRLEQAGARTSHGEEHSQAIMQGLSDAKAKREAKAGERLKIGDKIQVTGNRNRMRELGWNGAETGTVERSDDQLITVVLSDGQRFNFHPDNNLIQAFKEAS